MKSNLTVGFLTSSDPNDRVSWSGIHFQMIREFERHFEQVVPLGPVATGEPRRLFIRLINAASRIFLFKRYNLIHNNILARHYASTFKRKLEYAEFDLIFAPSSSAEIARLETTTPIFYFSDTSFAQIKDYYDFFSNLSAWSARESENIQSAALRKSHTVIHSSHWASDFVIGHYNIAKEKAFTVPMGANINEAPDLEAMARRLNNKTTCNLLFMGVEWERKGGAIAFEAFTGLNKLGINATLTVCGCVPPAGFSHPKLKVIPFLDKKDEEQNSFFYRIMADTHFLVLPTRAECAGIAFAEASAFGIPSITTDTGGVSSMVENGVNGYRLPLTAGPAEYAKLIKEIFDDEERYRNMVYSSRAKYETELNWQTWGEAIRDIIINNFLPAEND